MRGCCEASCGRRLENGMPSLSVKGAGWLEVAGLGLVLLSAGWQLFAEEPVRDIERRLGTYRIEDKLDAIWAQIGEIEKAVGLGAKVRSIHQNYASAHERWQWAGQGADELRRQVEMFGIIRAAAFLVGSCLLVVARWWDVQDRAERAVV